MEKLEKPLKEPGKLRQFLAALVVNLLGLSYGLVMGWQSPSTPQLQSSSPPVGKEPMTDNAVSWLTGILCLSGTITTTLLAIIPDKFSRKRFGYVIGLPMMLSWLLIVFSTEHIYIYVARALGGLAGACIFCLVSTYVSEISCDSIRGMLASILVFSVNFGILLSYILGGILSFHAFPISGVIISVLFFITFTFMPESPVYLVRQNRMREAIRSLKWLKAGNSLVAERTLSHIQFQVKEVASTRSAKFSDLYRDRATIKGLIISFGLFAGQQFCGIFAMLSNTETIFRMSGSSLSPNMSAIIVATIQLVTSMLAMFLVERAGRRPLLLLSCAGMFVCHCVMGVFCHLQSLQYEVSAYAWIPVIALSAYMLVYGLGMGNIPIVMTTEIFSRDVTSLGTTVGLIISWGSATIMTKCFTDIVALLDMHGCFYLLAIFCMCTFLFGFILLPETKGRAREDIVDELNGVRCTKNKNNAKHIIGTNSAHAAHV
ncbi:hypothetical protein P5V15_001864 [Pogonomyrmex californicus]